MDKLSTGAKIAIGIGSIIAISSIAYGVYYFTRPAAITKSENNNNVIDDLPAVESSTVKPVTVVAGQTGINKESFDKKPAPSVEKRIPKFLSK